MIEVYSCLVQFSLVFDEIRGSATVFDCYMSLTGLIVAQNKHGPC